MGQVPQEPVRHAVDGQAYTFADHRLLGSAQAGPPLPRVERHCANVTCSFYFAKSETNRIQQTIDKYPQADPLATAACAVTGPATAACAAGVAIHKDAIKKNVKDAVARRGCFVLRVNGIGLTLGAASPAAISFGNVAGTHQFCKP